MKILIFFALSLALCSTSFGQSTLPLRADTVVVEKIGGSAEFKLKNKTRDSVGGVLYNTGAGVTAFKKSRKINDSSIVIGGDTIRSVGGIIGSGNAQQLTYWRSATSIGGKAGMRADTAQNKIFIDSLSVDKNINIGGNINAGSMAFGDAALRFGNNSPTSYFRSYEDADNTRGKLWIAYPKNTCDTCQWNQPFYSQIGTTNYDGSQPINTVADIVKFGDDAAGRPMARLAMEQAFFGSTEFHLAFKPIGRVSEIRQMSTVGDMITGTSSALWKWDFQTTHDHDNLHAYHTMSIRDLSYLPIAKSNGDQNIIDFTPVDTPSLTKRGGMRLATQLMGASDWTNTVIFPGNTISMNSNGMKFNSFASGLGDHSNRNFIFTIPSSNNDAILWVGKDWGGSYGQAFEVQNNGNTIFGPQGTLDAGYKLQTHGNDGTQFGSFTRDAATNTRTVAGAFWHTSTGTTVAGFGSSIMLAGQARSNGFLGMSYLGSDFTDVTNGSENADFIVSNVRNGSVVEALRSLSTGGLRINNAYTLPDADGASGDVLTTNGAGSASWAPVSSIGIDGSIAADEVAVGSGTNTIAGFSKFKYVNSTSRITLGDGSTSASILFDYADGNSGALVGRKGGAFQLQVGLSNDAVYGGTFGSGNTGRQLDVYDNVAGAYRLGLNQHGNFFLGIDSATAGVTLTQDGRIIAKSLVGTGSRIVVADALGSLSAVTPASISANISNTALTANADYTQNWSNKNLRFDSVKIGFLNSYAPLSGPTKPRFTFINWSATSIGNPIWLGSNVLNVSGLDSVVNAYKITGSSNTNEIIASRNGFQSRILITATQARMISEGVDQAHRFSRVDTDTSKVDISARDSIRIAGVVRPTNTSDSALSLVNITHIDISNNPSIYKLSYVPLANSPLLKDSASSVAQVDINLLPFQGYDRIVIQIEKLDAATNDVELRMRFSVDGGSTIATGASAYEWLVNWRTSLAGQGVNSDDADDHITLVQNISNGAGHSAAGEIELLHPFDVTYQPHYKGEFTASGASGAMIRSDQGGRYTAPAILATARLYLSSGNIDKIKYRVIGYKN